MNGSKEGGAKTAQTIKAKYGEDFYAKIGAIGGSTIPTKPRGFAANRELARTAGAKGGQVSKRGTKHV